MILFNLEFYRFYRNLIFMLAAACVIVFCNPFDVQAANPGRLDPDCLSPEQITAETDPIVHMAVSKDGQWVVYASAKEGFSDLWLRSAIPSKMVMPRQLTFDPADESSPAFSPDGRLLAYTGNTYDVKGDIFILKVHDRQAEPLRLTGRDTEDGGAVFSKDGNLLYFHQSQSGEALKRLVVINLKDPSHSVRPLSIGKDGAFPNVSPDGEKLAFVSYKEDPLGDIYLYDLKKDALQPLVTDPYMDFLPTWSPDGQSVIFSRISVDTDRDGKLSTADNSVIYRIRADSRQNDAFPLTRLNYVSFQPQAVNGDLYFLSDRGGVSNCWKLPLSGVIPPKADASDQMALAKRLARRIPFDPFETLLAYYKVIERYPRNNQLSAQAGYAIGRLWQDLGMEDTAFTAFDKVRTDYSDVQPYSVFSKIQQVMVNAQSRLVREADKKVRHRLIQGGLAELDAIGQDADQKQMGSAISGRALVERARLLILYDATPGNLLTALQLLDQAVNDQSDKALAAEALILKAEIYQKIGRTQSINSIYLSIINNYAEQAAWSDKAVDYLITLNVKSLGDADTDTVIKYLREFYDKNREATPKLAIGALNRIGDLYFKEDKWAEAKAAYYQVLKQFSQITAQTTAARLALAEILYREERFKQALNLYEAEIAKRPHHDALYSLARNGYIQKSIASGEFLFQLGEVLSARKTFKELLDYDDTIIEAHRGYIKCAAALKDIKNVIESYRKRLAAEPDNPIVTYGLGLALTYLNREPALMEAKALLLRAIEIDGWPEYFHQTLGYVYEVSETVYHQKDTIKLALEAYKKAYFLNDHTNNRLNAANLLLNLGNTYMLLKNYGKAFTFYEKRLESHIPFDNPNTEILFYRRLGEAAYQNREKERSIFAYKKALDMIEDRMNPKQTTQVFDNLHRYIMDHILIPGLKYKPSENKPLVKAQSSIHSRLSELSDLIFPPPEPKWYRYKSGIKKLLDQQKELFPDYIDAYSEFTAEDKNITEPRPSEIKAALDHYVIKINEALRFPERLTEDKADVLGRLGLAYQVAGAWGQAAETFQTNYDLNKRLKLNKNLASAKRQTAYTTYRHAETMTGEARTNLLELSAKYFKEVIELVRTYGVAGPKNEKREALISINLQVSMDRFDGTQASGGFTAQQEKRMAEAFLTRIYTELGDLATAEKYLSEQLDNYPMSGQPTIGQSDKQPPDKNTFSVSLLYHQAGLLAYADGNLIRAFDDFNYSAKLCAKMNTPVSLGLNARNMAYILTDPKFPVSKMETARRALDRICRVADSQMAGTPFVSGRPTAADFHNAMGIYMLSTIADGPMDTNSAVSNMLAIEQAIRQFRKGLSYLTDDQGRTSGLKSRYQINMAAALYLNLANAACRLDELPSGRKYYEQALALSKKYFFPDIQWRALVGLGRLEEALTALESVTLLRAGCQKGEIMRAFGSQVIDLVNKKEIETAFNLAERLSELERFNRLAFIMTNFSEADKRLLTSVYKHFLNIRELKTNTRKKADKRFAETRIAEEQELIETKLGPERRFLPYFLRMLTNRHVQEQLIVALGVALDAENAADLVLGTAPGSVEYEALRKRYDALTATYHLIRKEAFENRSFGSAADLLTFLGPEPAEAIDVMENLPDNGRLVRLVQVQVAPDWGDSDSRARTVVFTLTPEQITARILQGGPNTWQKSVDETDSVLYIAYEDPAALVRPAPDTGLSAEPDALALSGTHWLRSVMSRKPFKRKILTDIPEDDLKEPLQEAYTFINWKPGFGMDINQALQGANTFLLNGKSAPAIMVPTRSDERARPIIAFNTPNGRRFPLERFLVHTANVSLTMLSGAGAADAEYFGHLLSILGCPSVMLPKHPHLDKDFINTFLKYYSEHTAADALRLAHQALTKDENNRDWILLGYRGLTPKAANALARKNFMNYVAQGKTLFKQNQPVAALSLFENAITIADNNPKKYGRYLGVLYQFCRESAYKGRILAKAALYARKLATLLEKIKPDTENHAEALLRLGLIQSQQENFEKAIPNLEEAVEMFANLELDEKWAQALSSFGIVLENATDYDRALVQFKSAADISSDMDQKTLLARQYTNIGRINDLRMSRYALAIQNYKKALALYRELGDTKKTAQALLDMGRCYRLIGNFVKADQLYQAAQQMIAATADDSEKIEMQGKIIIEQANNAWFQGRYEEAFQLQRKTFKIAQQHDFALLNVISLNTSGLIWWTLGNQDKALLELNNALQAAKALKFREDEVASTLNNIGLVYRENGRFREALEAFDSALEIDIRLKSRWAMAYDYRNQALTYLKKGTPDKALPLFEKAFDLAHAIGNRINEAKALLGLGEAHFAVGRLEEAADAYQKALELSKAMSIRETQWRAIFGLANIQLPKNPQTAIKLLYEAIGIIETVRSEIKIAQLKDSFVANKLAVYETLITVLADQGKIKEAFEIAERSRGRNFIDLLGNQQLSLNRDVDQKRYDRQLQLKAEIREYETLIAQATESVERKLYQRKLTDLTNELDSVMLEIQADNPQLGSIVSVEPLKTEQLLTFIEPGVVLLSYYVMPQEVFCWIIGGQDASGGKQPVRLLRTPVGSVTLGKKILHYRRLIQNLEPLTELSQELHKWLIAPAEPYLKGAKQLGIIPHGQLHYLSFATLSDQNNYLIDRYSLFYIPSASVLKYTLSKRKANKKYRVLAIGNPDLGDPSLALPFAEHEVNSIKWNFPDITILTHERATEKWVAENIDQFGIIHLASHGEFNPINPLFSAIKLSKGPKETDKVDKTETGKKAESDKSSIQVEADGNLEAGEVFSLNINADVVILSACQTGLGKVEQGDDVIGLNRAFFYAGTHTIISSLWRVSDISTAILLKQFYRQYLTMNKADSLRQATLHVKQRYVHPGYWGAFTLVGDYY